MAAVGVWARGAAAERGRRMARAGTAKDFTMEGQWGIKECMESRKCPGWSGRTRHKFDSGCYVWN